MQIVGFDEQSTECLLEAVAAMPKEALAVVQEIRSFDAVLPEHQRPIYGEFEREYQRPWPGSSPDSNYGALNWKGYVYVNEKHALFSSFCRGTNIEQIVALLMHEIYHILSLSNKCSNEPECLVEHEALAAMVETAHRTPQRRVSSHQIRRLFKTVFRDYIIPLVPACKSHHHAQKLHRLMYKRFMSNCRRRGVVNVDNQFHANALVAAVQAGKDHFEHPRVLVEMPTMAKHSSRLRKRQSKTHTKPVQTTRRLISEPRRSKTEWRSVKEKRNRALWGGRNGLLRQAERQRRQIEHEGYTRPPLTAQYIDPNSSDEEQTFRRGTGATPSLVKRSQRLAFQANDEMQLQVKKAARGMGYGLYAATAIAEGATVASMEQPLSVKSESYATRMGYPHDSVVWLRNKGYFDESFQRRAGYRPLWYRMNHAHASKANVELRITDDGTPTWVAKHNIHPQEEMRWDYGDHVPAAWNR